METTLYAVIKYAAYSGWCWVGLKLLTPEAPNRLGRALGWGTVRLGMGLGFGIAIWFLASFVAGTIVRSQPIVYLLVYVPVRWVEWGLIEAGIRGGGFRQFLVSDDASRGWRARGIVLSCLADIPVIVAMGGLPLGRFMC